MAKKSILKSPKSSSSFSRPSFLRSAALPSKGKKAERLGASVDLPVIDSVKSGVEMALSFPDNDSDEAARISAAADEFDNIENAQTEASVAAAIEEEPTIDVSKVREAIEPLLSTFDPSEPNVANIHALISALKLDSWSMPALRELGMASDDTMRKYVEMYSKLAEDARAQLVARQGGSVSRRGKGTRKITSKGTFRHPHDHSKVWMGKGRPPNWLVEAENRGHDISKWRVDQ